MKKIDRVLALNRLLHERRTAVTLAEIAQRLECSAPTAKRVIRDLRLNLGEPIVYDQERRGYFLDHSNPARKHELPGLWFSSDELRALLICHHILENLEPGFFTTAIAPLKLRLEQLVDSPTIGGETLAKRVRLLQQSRRGRCPRFPVVARATLDRCRLQLCYAGRAAGRSSRREVSPQRLVLYRDNWYLDAWCHSREALRCFAVERIQEAEVLPKPALDLDPSALDGHFSSAFGIFSDPIKGHAVLRFSPQQARWVADETWHPRQQSKWLEDGRFELRIPYGNSTELVMDILKYGPEVEVVEPECLREKVARFLSDAARKYKKFPDGSGFDPAGV